MTKPASYTKAEELPLASYIAGNVKHKFADLAKKTQVKPLHFAVYSDMSCTEDKS